MLIPVKESPNKIRTSTSFKKQKNSLETRVALLLSSYELEISVEVLQGIHQKKIFPFLMTMFLL